MSSHLLSILRSADQQCDALLLKVTQAFVYHGSVVLRDDADHARLMQRLLAAEPKLRHRLLGGLSKAHEQSTKHYQSKKWSVYTGYIGEAFILVPSELQTGRDGTRNDGASSTDGVNNGPSTINKAPPFFAGMRSDASFFAHGYTVHGAALEMLDSKHFRLRDPETGACLYFYTECRYAYVD